MFKYVISIEPLGLLYGSAGRFLSPDNLVGRSGESFPPSAAAASGLIAAHYSEQHSDPKELKRVLKSLKLAGPFWANRRSPQNFHVPTPSTCLTTWKNSSSKPGELRVGTVTETLQFHPDSGQWRNREGELPKGKFDRKSWVAIEDWKYLESGAIDLVQIRDKVWEFLPHLHPELQADQRHTVDGRLFLENSVQLHPDYCLVYLSSLPIESGWYRFGGEGHLADVRCEDLSNETKALFDRPVGNSFSLITPAIWGSNRLSYREPKVLKDNIWRSIWQVEGLLTERPTPFRYRFGGSGKTKRLSRGRYTVSAGTVYVATILKQEPLPEKQEPLPAWHKWEDNWFPHEGVFLNRWGCGLALPLPSALMS